MDLTYQNGIFSLQCDVLDNAFATQLGFGYDPAAKIFKTPFAHVASALNLRAPHLKDLIQKKLLEENRIYSDSFSTWADISVPCPEGLKYRGFQLAGIKFMRERLRECTNVLLADQMGIGKTIQVLGLLNLIPSTKEMKVLIVCPASLKINWFKEASKWLTVKRPIHVIDGDVPKNASIYIINYDILEKHHSILSSQIWDFVILDEAHVIKNPDAKRARAIIGGRKNNKKDLAPRKALTARHKIALTGTPILNRPIEIFTTLKFLSPFGFHSRFEYAKRYCDAHRDRYGRWEEGGASNLEELQKKLRSSIMIRRLKADVLKELPPKIRQVVELDTDSKLTQLVRLEWTDFERFGPSVLRSKDYLDEEEFKTVIRSLENGKINFDSVSTARKELALEKMPAVLPFLAHAVKESGKVICFCHHKEVVQKIRDYFQDACVVVDGSTGMNERNAAVEAFQTVPNVKLFVGNIIAAGVGLTLTASSHVIFVELDWRPGIVEQAEDRAHRIGATGDSVLIQHLVVQGSIDAIMAKTIVRKQEVIEAALDTGMSPELRALLS